MDDLISRQEVIRWVKTECNPYGKPTLDFESGKKVIEHLKQIPSAQVEIIRCKDCKHWTNNIGDSELRDNYCNEVAHGFYYRCNGDDFCSRAERRDNG